MDALGQSARGTTILVGGTLARDQAIVNQGVEHRDLMDFEDPTEGGSPPLEQRAAPPAAGGPGKNPAWRLRRSKAWREVLQGSGATGVIRLEDGAVIGQTGSSSR